MRGRGPRHTANGGRSQGSTLPGAGKLDPFEGLAATSAAGRVALAVFGDDHRRYMVEVLGIIPKLSALAGRVSRAGTQHW